MEKVCFTGNCLVDLSTAANSNCGARPWVKFQSAGWVNIQSARTRNHDNLDKKARLRGALEAGCKSLTAIAKEIGVDTATAMVWSASLGFEVSRRPKKLLPEVKTCIVASLRDGVDKVIVAEKFQISVTTVTHVLRTEVNLHCTWQRVRSERHRAAARAKWGTLLVEYKGLGTKFMRHVEPALYAWLYRNDRLWLSEQAPVPIDRTARPGARISWAARDDFLSSAVENAALRVMPALAGKKLRLYHLLQEIPELRAKQSALHKLPRTVRALEIALNRVSRRRLR